MGWDRREEKGATIWLDLSWSLVRWYGLACMYVCMYVALCSLLFQTYTHTHPGRMAGWMAGSLGGLNTFFSLLSVCLSVCLSVLGLGLGLSLFFLIHPSINQSNFSKSHPPTRPYVQSINQIYPTLETKPSDSKAPLAPPPQRRSPSAASPRRRRPWRCSCGG